MSPFEPTPRGSAESPAEHRLHEALRRLPDHAAPPTLVPNVLAIIRTREELRARTWWRRPVTLWPPALRVAFGAISLVLFAGIVFGGHLLWPEIRAALEASSLPAASRNLAAIGSALRSVSESLAPVLQSLVTPGRLAILGAILLSQFLLLGAGTTMLRAALRPRATGLGARA